MIPLEIQKYLISRGISEQIIVQAKLSWDGRRIIIPVFDKDNKIIFNKYRRSPFVTDGPKYMYDSGATSALYNINNCRGNIMYVCEGEFDALRLNSCGIGNAVSTTGGSKSFNPEWIKYFSPNGQVYVIYDNDQAGLEGAYIVWKIIPWARIVLLDKEKDVTDYLKIFKIEDLNILINKSRAYNLTGKIKDKLNQLQMQIREMIRNNEDMRFTELLLKNLMEEYRESKKPKFKPADKKAVGDKLTRAKQVSISSLIRINNDGFAKCIWHQEKTPSMKYNKERNVVHCFGCGKSGDAVDVYQQINNVDFKTALDALSCP